MSGTPSVRFRLRAWAAGVGIAMALALWPSCTTVDNLVAPTCTFAIAPAQASYGGSGGTGTFAVTAGDVCTWTVDSSASWVTITNGESGKGNGTVGYAVAGNSVASSRSTTLTVGGTNFAVTEGAVACAYTVSPTFASFPSDGGGGEESIATSAGCPWTASSAVDWITLTPTSGSGPGNVQYTVAQNTTSANRTGTATIGGQTLTVGENAATPPPCSFALSPQNASFDATGGTGTVTIGAQTGCAWTASADMLWITITSGSSGSGPGTVKYTVAANAGAGRSGNLTIGGTQFPIAQSAPACAYSIAPTSASFTAAGGAGGVTVTTTTGCAWTASSSVSWVTVIAGASGAGPGSVSYTVAANTMKSSRSTTLTVAGLAVAITEAAAADEPSSTSVVPSPVDAPPHRSPVR